MSTQDIHEVSSEAWAEAARRLEVIKPLAADLRRTRADVRAAGVELGCGVSQAYTLLNRYLLDPRLTSLLNVRTGRKPGRHMISADLEGVVAEAIEEVYLTRAKPTVARLVLEVRLRCSRLRMKAPSRGAIQRRVEERSAFERVTRREGPKAARKRYQPVMGSLEANWPLAIVQIDHTLVDVIVVDSRTRQPIQRPWLTLAIDVNSRCVTGFHLSLEPPSATSVALCLSHSALPKDAWLAERKIDETWPVRGIPECLHLDNGKDFRSEALKRGCEQYGIAIDYRPVRTPHYGGHIERLIGTMMGKVHLLPGTTFSNITEKGDLDPEKTAVMTLDEVERWLAHGIAGAYHRQIHRGIGVPPLTAWERGINGDEQTLGRGEPTAVVDPRRFLIDFLPIERRQVRREGVVLNKIAYWSDVLRTWIGQPERFCYAMILGTSAGSTCWGLMAFITTSATGICADRRSVCGSTG